MGAAWFPSFFLEVFFMMKPSGRRPVNKGKSAGSFRHSVGKTHPRNVKMAPRRGGWRL